MKDSYNHQVYHICILYTPFLSWFAKKMHTPFLLFSGIYNFPHIGAQLKLYGREHKVIQAQAA
jgi:hypothetical protein